MAATKKYIVNGLFDRDQLVASRQWQTLREGVFISPIYEEVNLGSSAAFLHYIPGARVPKHFHLGFEHIVILHGSQFDGLQEYRPGTLVIHSPDSHHQIHSPDGCVALGIWEKPVKFA